MARSQFVKLYLILLAAFSVQAHGAVICQLTPFKALECRDELQRIEAQHQRVRIATMVGGIGLAGLAIFKAFPAISEHKAFGRARSSLKSQDMQALTKAIEQNPSAAVAAIKSLMGSAVDKGVQQAKVVDASWIGWGKRHLDGIFSMMTMLAIPPISQSVVGRVRDVFGKRDLVWLANRHLELPEHFQKLKAAQIRLDPQQFLQNRLQNEDPALCDYAKELVRQRAQLSPEELQAIKSEFHETLVAECNYLISSMGYLYAQVKYLTNHPQYQSMLDKFAEELLSTTYEFGRTVEEGLQADKLEVVFKGIASFQSSFLVIMNNLLMFSKQ